MKDQEQFLQHVDDQGIIAYVVLSKDGTLSGGSKLPDPGMELMLLESLRALREGHLTLDQPHRINLTDKDAER